jgi:hypothetical protein
VAATAGCSNFSGLMTVRFLLGVAEATISPSFVYLQVAPAFGSLVIAVAGFWRL